MTAVHQLTQVNNMAKDNKRVVTLEKFYQGFSPSHWLNSLSIFGNLGHCNLMTNCNILTPEFITQGLGKAILTNGNEDGEVDELINFIMDRAITADVSFAIGDTKLFKLSATTVASGGSPSWPRTIVGATRGESIAYLKGVLYYIYQDDVGTYDLSSTFNDDYMSTVPTGAASLQDAPHPVATKQDIMLIGNGRYVAKFTSSDTTLNATKLDFGNNTEVADIVFHNNFWYIAINTSNANSSNRGVGSLQIWDGAALDSLLEDELSVGLQKIGFMKVVNGRLFIVYQDLTSSGFKLGYVSGSQLVPLVTFTGSLPTFKQKTLYEGMIAFIAGNKAWLSGAIIGELPFSLSQIATQSYTTHLGALAAPFGNLLIASDNGTNYKLEKFSGYTVTSNWTSLIIDLTENGNLAMIDEMVVYTEGFSSGGRVDVTLQYNDNSSNSGVNTINTASTRRHSFKISSGAVENVRVYLNFANGSASYPVKVKKIELKLHIIER